MDTSHEHAAHWSRPDDNCTLCVWASAPMPIVMVLLPREDGGRTVTVGSASDTSKGWACLPLMAAALGFERDEAPATRNVYRKDGRSYVGSWTTTSLAWDDLHSLAPSWYATSEHYRNYTGHARRRVLDALAVLRCAGAL